MVIGYLFILSFHISVEDASNTFGHGPRSQEFKACDSVYSTCLPFLDLKFKENKDPVGCLLLKMLCLDKPGKVNFDNKF